MMKNFRALLSLALCLIMMLGTAMISQSGVFDIEAKAYYYLECKKCNYNSEKYLDEDEFEETLWRYYTCCQNPSCKKYNIGTYYESKEERNKAPDSCPECNETMRSGASTGISKIRCTNCDYVRYSEAWEWSIDEDSCPKCNSSVIIEEGFKCPNCGDIANGYHRQFVGKCYYCMKVQEISETEIPDDATCPECGKPYDVQIADSIDENGKLLPDGAGTFDYCDKTGKIYKHNYDGNNTCIYCGGKHSKLINVYFELKCPDCGDICKRSMNIECYKEPVLLGSLGNILSGIIQSSLGEVIEPDSMDITNKCNNCQHFFTDADIKNAVRYVDAPADFDYEKAANDRPYNESYTYDADGSNNDSFFARLIWSFKNFFRMIRYIFSGTANDYSFDCI